MIKEYAAIQEFYGTRTAERSQVPLMQHIDEGLELLYDMGASIKACAAFCLHPIVQNNEVVDVSWSFAYPLACEYRDRANAYLCRPETDWVQTIDHVFSIVDEMSEDCRLMLIADKRQNQSDFMFYHFKTHARSKELSKYFVLWLEYLNYIKTYE